MPFTDVLPVQSKPATTGISFSLAVSKRSKVARLSFNANAQHELFGRLIPAMKFFAKIGRGSDEGKLLLLPDEQGDLEARPSTRDGVSIRMKAWDLLPEGKVPAQSIEMIGSHAGGFLFELPKWAKPSAVGGKMDQEFGLKREGAKQGKSVG